MSEDNAPEGGVTETAVTEPAKAELSDEQKGYIAAGRAAKTKGIVDAAMTKYPGADREYIDEVASKLIDTDAKEETISNRIYQEAKREEDRMTKATARATATNEASVEEEKNRMANEAAAKEKELQDSYGTPIGSAAGGEAARGTQNDDIITKMNGAKNEKELKEVLDNAQVPGHGKIHTESY